MINFFQYYSIEEVRHLIYERYRIKFNSIDILNLSKNDLSFFVLFKPEFKNHIFINNIKISGLKFEIKKDKFDELRIEINKAKNEEEWSKYFVCNIKDPIAFDFDHLNVLYSENENKCIEFEFGDRFTSDFYNDIENSITDKGIIIPRENIDRLFAKISKYAFIYNMIELNAKKKNILIPFECFRIPYADIGISRIKAYLSERGETYNPEPLNFIPYEAPKIPKPKGRPPHKDKDKILEIIHAINKAYPTASKTKIVKALYSQFNRISANTLTNWINEAEENGITFPKGNGIDPKINVNLTKFLD